MIDREEPPPGALPSPFTCEETVRALWDYLDRELDAPTMAAIDAHLARCDGCREHARFERELIDRIHALRRDYEDASPLRARVLHALGEAGWRRIG
ncbi:MAG: anti-sigma factor [Gemmatimonadaceae bacterium]